MGASPGSTRLPGIRGKSSAARIFKSAVIATGFFLIALSIYSLIVDRIGYQWLILASLTVLTGTFTVKIPGVNSKISVADTFIFTNLILFGPHAGAITAALDALMAGLRIRTSPRRLEYALFNMAAMATSAFLSAQLFFHFLGRGPLFYSPAVGLREIAAPVTLLALSHYLLNSGAVSVIVALEQQRNIYRVWRESFLWTSATYFTGASVAALVAVNATAVTPAVVGLVVPVLLVTYFTYKTYLDKVLDQVRHLEDLNRLYLRTVESLALAVDAKDHSTHGHIRRVRAYAMGLARLCGITDARELMAIETGSLLHDIGKLAIDDYILNKPGRLSRQEFEKMKVHASAGDEILQQVQFPFPVARYVRSHHERWDGNGYPDGLRGEEIPIGARILTIADAYDAIRSSRPYKESRGMHEAVELLRAEAGTIFDPSLVEMFVENVEDLEASARDALKNVQELSFRKTLAAPDSGMAAAESDSMPLAPESSVGELISLQEFSSTYASRLNLADLLLNLDVRIRRLIPCDTSVFYLENGQEQIEVAHASGLFADLLRGRRMTLGKGISGWVAAYGRSMVKTGASLEFQELQGDFARLRDALVVPLTTGEECIGAISLYAEAPDIFTHANAVLLESVARMTAPVIAEVSAAHRQGAGAAVDSNTGLRVAAYLSLAGPSLLETARKQNTSLSVILLDIENIAEMARLCGNAATDRILRRAARELEEGLRGCDVLVRYGQGGFVALVPEMDPAAAPRSARRLKGLLERAQPGEKAGGYFPLVFRAGYSSFPSDAEELPELLETAQKRCAESARDETWEDAGRQGALLEFPLPP